VLQAGATTRWVYLPGTDRWTDVRTGISYTGGQHVTIDAPLGRVPMFAREGAILPRGPVRQWVSQPVPARMDVDIYPGPDFAYSLYEDDGESFDYQAGEFLRTQLGHATVGEETRFTIERTEGTWTPAPRPWMLTFHQLAVPSSVELNGAPLPFVSTPALLDGLPQGWTYLTGNRLFVKVQDAAAPLSVRVRP
jgi:hypothetical protein